jgi:5S rRNA maturation endonuclease (ribonuclease M5)
MMPQKILCVAEKPAIAKAVAQHLSGGRFNTESIRGNRYVKNYEFDFNFRQWGNCSVVMTSVLGHLTGLEFDQAFRGWRSCAPQHLFEAPTQILIDQDKKSIAENIQQQARFSRFLFIWTDCDREGEHIGSEVQSQAIKGNNRITVKRARFSNTERAHVIQAAHNPIDLDERQANAVAARIELDLRIGAAFTRMQTLQLQGMSEKLAEKIISYGELVQSDLKRHLQIQGLVNSQLSALWSTGTTAFATSNPRPFGSSKSRTSRLGSKSTFIGGEYTFSIEQQSPSSSSCVWTPSTRRSPKCRRNQPQSGGPYP